MIPAVLALSALLFSRAERRNEQTIANQRIAEERIIANQRIAEERKIAENRTQDAALQSYFEQMSIFLIDKELRKSEEGSEERALARGWTLTFLRRLDGDRQGVLLRFLYESELIIKDTLVVSLRNADLSGVNLSAAHLVEADLSETNLSGANLSGVNLESAYLSWSDLSYADLREVGLSYANLSGSDLSYANLSGSDLSYADLSYADLSYAKYNSATKWPDGFDHASCGAILEEI